jgi:hypothetical protein
MYLDSLYIDMLTLRVKTEMTTPITNNTPYEQLVPLFRHSIAKYSNTVPCKR